MNSGKLLVGIILSAIGILFFFNNKNIGKGVYAFYRKFYTKENLTIIFKVLGIFLFVAGLILIFVK